MIKEIRLSKKFFCDVNFEDDAIKFVSEKLRCGGKIGVACSGGADSVFLLFALMSIFPKYLKNFSVLHFNHKARENAEIDESFVREICRRCGLDFICGSASGAPAKISEDNFRRMRLSFFEESAEKFDLSCIAQGHHADDLCETLLMRIMRGAGTEGLSAPRPVSNYRKTVFVRPLLRIKKAEICNMLKSAQIGWREDESNAENTFLRNKIRNGLLAEFIKISPFDFYETASRLRMLAQEDSDFIAKLLNVEIAQSNPDFFEIRSGKLECLKPAHALRLTNFVISNRALLRRAVYLLLSVSNISKQIRAGGVDDFVGGVINFPSVPRRASLGSEFLSWTPSLQILEIAGASAFEKPDSYDISLMLGKNILPSGDILYVKKATLGADKKAAILRGENDNSSCVYIDMSAAGTFEDGALGARTRLPKDAYTPIGATSDRSVLKLFSSQKVPASKRNTLPIVYNKKGEILWAPHLPPSKNYALENSRVAIELTFERK